MVNNAELERELRESVTYFEQILDVLPGERTALEFLCVACRQLGDETKFLRYALELTELVVRAEDAEGAVGLIDKLSSSSDPRAKKAVLKLQILTAPKPELKFERPCDRVTAATSAAAAQAELKLLDRLVTEGVLSRGAVQAAYDQLEHLPTSRGDFLISALSILEKENLTGAADAVAAVADAAGAPPVPLEAFELVPADVRRLPEKLIRVRGAVPFAKLGDEWAVAVLNPLNGVLREEIAASMGAKCHFFLTPPGQVEKALERVFGEDGGKNGKVVGEVSPIARPLGERVKR